MKPITRTSISICLAITALATSLRAQTPAAVASPTNQPARGPQQGPNVVSPEVASDRHVTFRILAPKAEKVRLNAGDIQGIGQNTDLVKGENGVWELTLGPVDPGAYRYNFNVDGVSVIDPRSPVTSESNNNTWSLAYVPGSTFSDTLDVPHGNVAAVTYYSKSLKKFRRMHVYTPPGYEHGGGKFPVLYLLHGAGDSDESWGSVGRAGFILDNLIAAKKAKPMIIVMPAGHTSSAGFRPSPPGTPDEFVTDFNSDLMPFAESHFRIRTERSSRAIAGLSMGGNQTLNIAIPHLDRFAYIGVYSSGLFELFRPNRNATNAPTALNWEQRNQAQLDNPKLKKGLKLFWVGIGKEDFLLDTSHKTVTLLTQHGFNVTSKESGGGHTWVNWRDYLNEFTPQLFQRD